MHSHRDGVLPVDRSVRHAVHFAGQFDGRVIPVAGHLLSRETPQPFVQALRDLMTGPR